VPAWRTRVAYVSQAPPDVAGTPLELFYAVRSFKAQSSRPAEDPVAIGKNTVNLLMSTYPTAVALHKCSPHGVY
jgi:hypothetical protein